MKRAHRLTLGLLLAVALVGAACGGGDDTESTPSTTVASDGAATTGSSATVPATTAGKVDPKLCPVKALDTAKIQHSAAVG